MRKVLLSCMAVACAALLTGCGTVATPVLGWVYTDVQWGAGATSNSGSSKVGTAKATSYLGVVGVGDASIKAACDSAGITKIHHVDVHSKHILIIGWYETTVYGE